MKKLRILIGVFAAVCTLALTSCGMKSYSAKAFFEPYVTGYEGSGTFNMKINSDMEEQIVNECMPGDATGTEELFYYTLLESIEYDAEPEQNLSNGDKVKVKIKCDEDALAAKKIKFTDTEFIYTVEGLEEAIKIDLMKDVNVTFEGLSPNGEVKIEYAGNDDVIKNNVSYSYTGEVKNGGSITVKASYSQAAFDEKNYIADESTIEKEFTVSGLDEYLHEKIDLSEIDTLLDVRMNEAFNDSKYAVGENIESMSFLKSGSGGNRWVNYVVKNSTIKPVGHTL